LAAHGEPHLHDPSPRQAHARTPSPAYREKLLRQITGLDVAPADV
jgi:hypothetical protein